MLTWRESRLGLEVRAKCAPVTPRPRLSFRSGRG
jgi:hypothetical protein